MPILEMQKWKKIFYLLHMEGTVGEKAIIEITTALLGTQEK